MAEADRVIQADALWRQLARTGQVQKLYRNGDPAAGIDVTALRSLFRKLDTSQPVGANLGICAQAATALPLLAAAGRRGDAIQASVTTAVLHGEQMIGLAATDVTPGSDLAALTTTLTLDGDPLVLSGGKQWITNATFARHLLVLARHREGRGFTNFTWVLVPTDAPGVTVESAPVSLFSGSGTGHATFRQVTLPRAFLCGAPGRGLIDFSRHISVERLASAVWGHAMCQRVLRQTIAYLRERGDLWDKDEIRHQIAACLLSVTHLGTLIDIHQHDVADRQDSLAAGLLKASAAQAVEKVLSVASHLQGAQSFSDGGLQMLRAQAALWSIGGGTYEVMLSTIADHADRLLDAAS
jgi:citronellyl-CoA dehydrogenase